MLQSSAQSDAEVVPNAATLCRTDSKPQSRDNGLIRDICKPGREAYFEGDFPLHSSKATVHKINLGRRINLIKIVQSAKLTRNQIWFQACFQIQATHN
jgi:hypothetical protein